MQVTGVQGPSGGHRIFLEEGKSKKAKLHGALRVQPPIQATSRPAQ